MFPPCFQSSAASAPFLSATPFHVSHLKSLIKLTLLVFLIVVSHLRLSSKPITAWENLWPTMFFSVLILIGYSSVVSTVVELAQGEKYLGYRPDILSKQ